MKLPRNVRGRELANHLIRRWDFVEQRQTGSHIILRTQVPGQYTISVPDHRPMRTGTFHDLVAAVAEHKKVSVQDILRDL